MDKYVIYLMVLCTIYEYRISSAAPSVSDPSERYFVNFMEKQASMIGGGCNLSDDLSDRVDSLLVGLDSALSGLKAKKLAAGLKQAINLNDLKRQHTIRLSDPWEIPPGLKSKKPKPKNKLHIRKTRDVGLADALDVDYKKNPHVIEPKRTVDLGDLAKNVQAELKRLPRSEEEALLNASSELLLLEDRKRDLRLSSIMALPAQPIMSPVRAIMRTVASVARYGFEILDRFHNSVEFLISLPVIGAELKKVKEREGKYFDVINVLRHAYYLLKLSGKLITPGGSRPIFDKQRVIEAKKMISQTGTKALRSIVRKLLGVTRAKIPDEYTQEFVSRVFYASLSALLLQNADSCTFPAEDLVD